MGPSQVSYHAKKLEELNLIELVDERPVRGAMEHFYRTVDLVELSEEDYGTLPFDSRRAWLETVMGLFGADAMYSIETDTLLAQDDCEISRTSMRVDRQGWEDIKDVFVQAQERVMEIKAEAESRVARDDLPSIPILSFLSLFEMPRVKR